MINSSQTNFEADQLIMQDLFDCLYAEGVFDTFQTKLLSSDDFSSHQNGKQILQQLKQKAITAPDHIWHWQTDENLDVYMPVEKGIVQHLQKQTNGIAYTALNNEVSPLSSARFMNLVGTKLQQLNPDSEKGTRIFQDMLNVSIEQTALSQQHNIETNNLLGLAPINFFQTLEEWASIRDRPYHPIAKAKMGLSERDYLKYMAEFSQDIKLNWVAVESSALCLSEGVKKTKQTQLVDYLVTPNAKSALEKEMAEKGLNDSHTLLPVHPWQLENYIKIHFKDELQNGTCHVLSYQESPILATSSLRSMSPTFHSEHYLKLPMAIYSLAASRYLPAVKMINGGLSEALLRQGLTLDARLTERVFVCDETKWWAYFPEGTSLFDEIPRHLSAMVRTYPKELLGDEYRLIPMAALGTPLPGSQRHFFDDWMQYLSLTANTSSVIQLFREVCHTFFDINLRMFKIGMLAEVHGQNTVLVWKQGKAHGLLLRDHDSLRIFVPWLEQQGLKDPEYQIKKGHANTLYHDNPEDLLFYLQTLGIQVNLRSIIDTLSITYDISAAQLWLAMQEVITQLLDDVGFSEANKAMIEKQLFTQSHWPLKLLIKPIIERAGGPGSMPFGKGEAPNPFQQLKAR